MAKDKPKGWLDRLAGVLKRVATVARAVRDLMDLFDHFG